MSRYAWIGKDLSETSFHPGGQGTAYRLRTTDGKKMKGTDYEPFDAVLKSIHQKTRLEMRGRKPVKPRMSRKGKPLCGILPRLCGY
jgi:hypothetical protein